ncbi:hypothetical protein B6U93_01195 [Candidatus Woesearchaeota archaeon ex4484_78]|nr:MAG: hypothetical protein B6U93_01195 [Candidatus Woesearchaeota archaeon ex4484_78]
MCVTNPAYTRKLPAPGKNPCKTGAFVTRYSTLAGISPSITKSVSALAAKLPDKRRKLPARKKYLFCFVNLYTFIATRKTRKVIKLAPSSRKQSTPKNQFGLFTCISTMFFHQKSL